MNINLQVRILMLIQLSGEKDISPNDFKNVLGFHHNFYVKKASCKIQDFTRVIFIDVAGVYKNMNEFKHLPCL